MNERAARLRAELRDAERVLSLKKLAVADLEHNCVHRFTEPKYDPVVKPGYYDPGDPPGTMGIDRRLPMQVPEHRTDRWTRTCTECGKVEHTTNTSEHVTRIPRFP